MSFKHLSIIALLMGIFISGCVAEEFDYISSYQQSLTKIHTELNYFKDEYNRYVYFHGVNTGPQSKLPDPISGSFVGEAFGDSDTDIERHMTILQELGFNSIRLCMTWDSVEPDGSSYYGEASPDLAYLDYIERVVQIAAKHGIYVLMDMHQDLFSRHLKVKYNTSVEGIGLDADFNDPNTLFKLGLVMALPNNTLQGDGAPDWIVEEVLPEKAPYVEGANWGTFKILVEDNRYTSDFYPISFWGLNGAISMDCNRGFAAFLCGDDAFPGMKASNGVPIQEYMQKSFFNAWKHVVQRVHEYPNVIGYDIINEPVGAFPMLAIVKLLMELGVDLDPDNDALLGAIGNNPVMSIIEGLDQMITSLQNDLSSMVDIEGFDIYLDNLFPDATGSNMPQSAIDDGLTVEEYWGVDQATSGLNLLMMHFGFLGTYMSPFYEGASQVIAEVDNDAIIWIEPAMSIETVLGMSGLGGQWEQPLTRPPSAPQCVYAPHWYPDVYSELGLGKSVRSYPEEFWNYRDFTPNIEHTIAPATYSLGNVPVVMGEFGTPFNFDYSDRYEEGESYVPIYSYDDKAFGYPASINILDNYYEVYEKMMLSHMQWSYSIETDWLYGEGWNEEDFSILDPNGNPRGEVAYSRPYPRAMSGKPITMHFYSPLHYFDVEKGIPNPVREFELEMGSKETEAPTEIFVPGHQYSDGFYVWVSDGYCVADYNRRIQHHDYYILYWFPSNDTPGEHHKITIRPPYADRENLGWDYFFFEENEIQR
jgi:hypothetical protein